MSLSGFDAQSLQNEPDVVLDREVLERTRFLGKVRDTHSCAAIHRLRSDITITEYDATFVWLNKADHHIERGGLSGTVRTKKTYDLARCDTERYSVHDPSASIGLAKTLRNEIKGFRAQGVSSG